jgi:hypothetical protein
MKTTLVFGLTLLLSVGAASAGPLDPDCTAEKAVKDAARNTSN